MNILIAGASGFIGQELVHALIGNHNVTALGCTKNHLQKSLPENIKQITWDDLPILNAQDYDVIINLCGYNIAAKRWTNAVKQQIIYSRIATTNNLIQWAIQCQAKPRFFCANAVGIYGLQEDGDTNALDESSPIGNSHDFLSKVAINWQNALQPALDAGIPVTITRFGVVLKRNAGMLKKLELSFKLGLGCTLGTGKQILSWVHIDDVIRAFEFLLSHPELTGPFNVTSPYPISQAEFAKTFAQILHRPLFLNMPATIVRLLFGEMGECLLLKGQRVLPTSLMNAGFVFRYHRITEALQHEFKS